MTSRKGNIFESAPFIRISMLFSGGIILGGLFQFPGLPGWIVIVSVFLSLFVLQLLKNYRAIQLSSIGIALALILFGAWYSWQMKPEIEHLSPEKAYYQATLLEKPVAKKQSYQALMELVDAKTNSRFKIISWFSKKTEVAQLLPGQQILLHSKLNQISNQGNPFEFDYQSYMYRQGIQYSAFINPQDYQLLSSTKNNLFIWAENLRNRLLTQIRKHGVEGEEYTVVAALTLGYRKELDPETRDYFASSGAMHVLAVSGLHVGIVFLIFTTLFAPLRKRKSGKLIYLLIIGSLIWLYALLSGLSPSVQRASVMFSFILIGQNMNRPANIFNSLAASAFLLMLFSPLIIYEVGFQLSYFAVTGIVLFYPLFFKMLDPKNFFLQKIWGLLCVSLAAQLSTFALGIFYFSQFPNYFWLSNFIVIPAASIILPATFFLLAASPIVPIADLSGLFVQKITHLMLLGLKTIDKLPFALTDNLAPTGLQTILILLIIAAFYWFVSSKDFAVLRLSLILSLAFFIVSFTHNIQLFNQQKIIVYRADQPLLHLIHGRENYILGPPEFINSEQVSRIINPVCTQLKLNSPQRIPMNGETIFNHQHVSINKQLIRFSDQTILWNSSLNNSSITADLGIFTSKHLPYLSFRNVKKVILTGRRNASAEEINHYCTHEKGAFILTMSK